ncbi:RNA polymerase sigma factor [Enterococcus olivae]
MFARGYSYEEISLILKLSVSTVKSRIFHARKKLRSDSDE